VKHEDKIAIDRPRVGSSFCIHKSFASVGSFATCMDQPLVEKSLTSQRETIFEYHGQMRVAISFRETWVACRRRIHVIYIILRHSARTHKYIRTTNVLSVLKFFFFPRKRLNVFIFQKLDTLNLYGIVRCRVIIFCNKISKCLILLPKNNAFENLQWNQIITNFSWSSLILLSINWMQ